MKKKKISAKGGSASGGKNKKSASSRAKKSVRKFLSSEKGKISKRGAARLGMGILAAGMGLSGLTRADAQCWTPPGTGTGTGSPY